MSVKVVVKRVSVRVVPAGLCPLPLPSFLQLLSAGVCKIPHLLPLLLTSKCQHISLLIGTISSRGGWELTHSIIRIMVILIRWGGCTAGQEMHDQLHIGIFNELTEWQSIFLSVDLAMVHVQRGPQQLKDATLKVPKSASWSWIDKTIRSVCHACIIRVDCEEQLYIRFFFWRG